MQRRGTEGKYDDRFSDRAESNLLFLCSCHSLVVVRERESERKGWNERGRGRRRQQEEAEDEKEETVSGNRVYKHGLCHCLMEQEEGRRKEKENQ